MQSKWVYGVIVGLVVLLLAFAGGYQMGVGSCKPDYYPEPKPTVHIVRDTVEVPPQWMLDFIQEQNKALAAKPRRDTLFLTNETVVRDSFPYPVYVQDTSARFWWPERATFGQKVGDVTTVVTREPFSGRASVLQYSTPGPVESFVADTSPRPNITFGRFVQPKRHHGLLVDVIIGVSSFGLGLGTGAVAGCFGG